MLEMIHSHSLFSEALIRQGRNRVLLLQCILAEIFSALSAPPPSLPALQKMIKLLPTAFPSKKNKLSPLISTLFIITHSKTLTPEHLSKLFFLLEPFMKECKNDESFLFFLLSHQKEISMLFDSKYLSVFLSKIYPKGLHFLQKHLCDYFHKKGFPYLLPTVKSLVDQAKNI